MKIPRTVRLACYAITTGVADYEGPDKDKKPEKAKKSKKAESHENGHDAEKHDKKAKNGRLTLILARGIGKAFIQKDADLASLQAFLRAETPS